MTLTIKPSKYSSIKIYDDGREVMQKEHKIKEATQLGVFRGGNTGALIGTSVIGACHRKVLARSLGINTPINTPSLGYFDAGYSNEVMWEEKYKKAWPHEIKFESECATKWTTSNGYDVTGSPDLMLFKDDKPVLGLELKALAASGSASTVYHSDKPKTENLLQTAHYSMEWKTPFILVYTYNGNTFVPYWDKKTYNVPKDKMKILPFKSEFHLGWEDGKLHYISNKGKRVDTLVTEDSIRNFYELVGDMAAQKTLYDRPAQMEADGTRAKWDPCGLCEFRSACDNYEQDYDRWMDEVRVISEGG